MSNHIVEISITNYPPRTYGDNDLEKKRELRDLILAKIPNLDEIKKK